MWLQKQEEPSRDLRADVPVTHNSLRPAQKLVVIAFFAAGIFYFTWRLGSLNPQAMVFSWLLFVAECYGLFAAVLHTFMCWRLKERQVPEAPPDLTVDVFVPTLNEPVSMVRKTLIAAANMDYPHQTWLLDDGNRPEMEALARELGHRYLARTDQEDAKAGNLNHALAHSQADFVALFDADHAPQRDFLTRTLGYFRNPRVAFVQTPQDFYNLDSYQHRRRKRGSIWTEQGLFFRVIQRGKDCWNAAFFCGSCAVVRREALDAIGGFATGTITEDLHTSIRLHKQGYESVYHAESLAFGLAPQTVVPFLRQRVRWGQGAMQTWRKEGIIFCRGLTFAQRLNYLASVLTYFDGWQKLLFYLAPIFVLTTGIMPIKAAGPAFFARFIPYYLLNFWAFEELGRGFSRTLLVEQYNMARFAAFAYATLAVFKRKLKFAVTMKSRPRRRSVLPYILPQVLILTFNGLAIPVGLLLFSGSRRIPAGGLALNIAWASINVIVAVATSAFTLGKSHRRSEYRFRVPLPAEVKAGERRLVRCTAEDISSEGLRLSGKFGDSLAWGEPIEGKIYLPNGPVPFRATIRHLEQSGEQGVEHSTALGCSFDWARVADQTKLELFLYGSDLQWRLSALREQSLTPLEWLEGLLSQREVSMPGCGVERWDPITYTKDHTPATQDSVGLISASVAADSSWSLLSFQAIPAGSHIEAHVFAQEAESVLQVQVADEQRLVNPISPIYLYQARLVGA